VTRIAVRPDLNPVNGEAFRQVDMAINGKNAAAVVRVINGTMARKPDASVKRQPQEGAGS
jgi:hypothetical protein